MAQYNPPTGYPQNDNYQQIGYPPNGYQQNQNQYPPPPGEPQSYPMQPPNYPPQGGAPPMQSKPGTFEEQFVIEKPKYNDWWAGLLVSPYNA